MPFIVKHSHSSTTTKKNKTMKKKLINQHKDHFEFAGLVFLVALMASVITWMILNNPY
jgi:hypothetical protein